jgi:hypothetical protein
VIPNPSCPAAIHKPGVGSHAPMSGSLSGVAGRIPVHARIADSLASPGMYAIARASMRASTSRFSDASHPTSSREEPTSTCWVARGCTLNATDAAVIVLSLNTSPSPRD